MTRQQFAQATPTRDSYIHHANQGCETRHRTNEILNRCEDKRERKASGAVNAATEPNNPYELETLFGVTVRKNTPVQ